MAFGDVFDASEIDVSVGAYDEGTTSWDYTTLVYRRNLSVDKPDNTRAVYDKLTFKGSKRTRGENTLSIEQEFQGFGEGLYPFENDTGLVVKVEIVPHEAEVPTDNIRYYTNWCPGPISWDAPDEGEWTISLEGNFNEETDTEPADNNF